jgi:hypothetical protein
MQDHGARTDMVVRLTAATALRECVDVVVFFVVSDQLAEFAISDFDIRYNII